MNVLDHVDGLNKYSREQHHNGWISAIEKGYQLFKILQQFYIFSGADRCAKIFII